MADSEPKRDVVNAGHLRKTLVSRSDERGDKPQVAAWMGKQFHRWIVATFEHTRPLADSDAFQEMTGEPAPDWLRAKLAEDGPQPLVLIDPEHPYLREVEARCVEWLRSRADTPLAEKFARMTPPHVLKHWRTEHERMARASEKGLLKTSGEALKLVLRRNRARIVEFDPQHPELRKELNNESIRMGHCVGQFEDRDTLQGGYGEDYASEVEAERLRLFSLRDGRGAPHVTIAIQKIEDAWVVEQIKGKQNRPPVMKYLPPIKSLLSEIKVEARPHRDCAALGLFAQDGEFVPIEALKSDETQMHAVILNPELAGRIDQQSPALKWLIALSAPKAIAALRNPDPVLKIAAALLEPGSADLYDPVPPAVSKAAAGTVSGAIDGEPFRLARLQVKPE